jgi:hypothetical protein
VTAGAIVYLVKEGAAMSSFAIGLIVVACLSAGAITGFLIRLALPGHHLSTESKDTIKLGTGLIGTMAALVLGLLVGSTKGSYDTQKAELTQMSAKMILLDRALAHFGPEAKETREQLKVAAERMLGVFWRDGNEPSSAASPSAAKERLYDLILSLAPKTDAERSIQSQALSMAVDIGQTRWLLQQQSGSSVSTVFLVILIFWLSVTFISFGLFAPANATVIFTFVLCAFSVAAAVFLILELDHPFSGMIQIPKETLRSALEQLGR